MNVSDLINAAARQFIAARTNIRTTSIGIVCAFGYLALQFRANKVITLSDIEMAAALAALGSVAKDGDKTGAPPKQVIGSDGI